MKSTSLIAILFGFVLFSAGSAQADDMNCNFFYLKKGYTILNRQLTLASGDVTGKSIRVKGVGTVRVSLVASRYMPIPDSETAYTGEALMIEGPAFETFSMGGPHVSLLSTSYSKKSSQETFSIFCVR